VPALESAPEFFPISPETPLPQNRPQEDNILPSVQHHEPSLDCHILSRELEIPGIRSSIEKNASILSWDALPKAQAYRVYKADASGKMLFLAEVTEPQYEILFSSSELSFEEFGVRAVVYNDACDLNTTGYSVTSIQTGTTAEILAILSAVSTVYIVRRRSN